mgnify:CR=1 FL=1
MDLTRNIVPTSAQAPRVARLTRHLKARLEDFGPGGPEVVQADQATGTVRFRVPGKDSSWGSAGTFKSRWKTAWRYAAWDRIPPLRGWTGCGAVCLNW